MQRCVPARGGCVHIRSCFNEHSRHVDRIAQGNAGVERLVAQRIMRDLVDMGSMLKQQGYSFRSGKCCRQVKRWPAISRDGARHRGVVGNELLQTVAVAQTRSLRDIQIACAPPQEIPDDGLACVYVPHKSGDALRITATRQGGIRLNILRNFCRVAAADQVQEVLAHGASIVPPTAGSRLIPITRAHFEVSETGNVRGSLLGGAMANFD